MSCYVKNFDSPDNTINMEKVTINVCNLCGNKAAKLTVQPGWRWSTCIKPIVKTESCQVRHMGCLVQGKLTVKMDNGEEYNIKKGDAYVIEPGHDAWVEGDEEVIGYEFESKAIENLENKN